MKKIYRLLAVLVCVFALSGCDSKDSKGIDFPASNQDDFEQVVKNWAESVDQMSDKDIEDNLAEMEGNEEYQSVIDALNSYLGCEEELGGYKEIKSFKYEKGDEKNQYNAIAKAKYKKRDCNIKCTFSVQQDVASLESLSFEPIYTTAENLKNAFINTILGMGTVFAVLILIAFIISLFEIIHKIENTKKEKEEQNTVNSNLEKINNVNTVTEVVPEENIIDDGEIVAVISAAIAAYEGTSKEGFVVRSIRKIR